MIPGDISLPLKNSFIHTGHGGSKDHKWGNIEYIDQLVNFQKLFFIELSSFVVVKFYPFKT